LDRKQKIADKREKAQRERDERNRIKLRDREAKSLKSNRKDKK
jgi:hypothetical protein